MNYPTLSDTQNSRWLYGLLVPFIYVVVEFSFNHRLITALDETVSDAVLENLEFWGRLIAGVGLGLMIHRLLLKVSSYRFFVFGRCAQSWHRADVASPTVADQLLC